MPNLRNITALKDLDGQSFALILSNCLQQTTMLRVSEASDGERDVSITHGNSEVRTTWYSAVFGFASFTAFPLLDC